MMQRVYDNFVAEGHSWMLMPRFWPSLILFTMKQILITSNDCVRGFACMMTSKENWIISVTLCVLLVTFNWILKHPRRNKIKHRLRSKSRCKFRKREQFFHYGQRLMRSARRYTDLLNQHRAMFKFSKVNFPKSFDAKRRRRRTLTMPYGVEQSTWRTGSVPRFMLDFDTESTLTQSHHSIASASDINEFLKSVKIFRHFDANVITRLCRSAYTRFVPAGSYLFRIGDFDDAMFIVRQGLMQLILTENERSRFYIKQCSDGENIFSFLSIADYLAGVKRKFKKISCKALKDSDVIVLPFDSFVSAFKDYPESLVRFAQMIMLRFRRITFMTLHEQLGLTEELMQTVENNDRNTLPVLSDFEISHSQENQSQLSSDASAASLSGTLLVSSNNEDMCQQLGVAAQASVEVSSSFLPISDDETEQVATPFYLPVYEDPDRGSEYANSEDDCDMDEILRDVQNDIAEQLGVDVSMLDGKLSLHSISADTVIMKEGEQSGKIVYLVKGNIAAVCRSPPEHNGNILSKEKLLFWVKPKQFAGVMSVMTGEPSLFSLKAWESCIVCVMVKDSVYGIVRLVPPVVLRLMQAKIRRMTQFSRHIDSALEWTFIESGKTLFKEGQGADNVYIILSGRVRCVRLDPVSQQQQQKHLLGDHGRGETVGFLEVFMDIPRQCSAAAVRDTETVQISSGLLNYLKATRPHVLSSLMQMARQTLFGFMDTAPKPPMMLLSETTLSSELIPRRNQNLSTIAIFPISEEVPIEHFSQLLLKAVQSYGSAVCLTKKYILKKLGPSALSNMNEHRLSAWLGQQEELNRLVIYECSHTFDSWTQRCVRQADCVLALGIFWTSPDIKLIERQIQEHSVRAQKELVLLHILEEGRKPKGTANWLRHRKWCTSHHHIRCSAKIFLETAMSTFGSNTTRGSSVMLRKLTLLAISNQTEPIDAADNTTSPCSNGHYTSQLQQQQVDMHRLARSLMGRSVGVVLGGGGARGISHLGLLKAASEHGTPVDMIGGTSIGSFVGALYASDLDIDACTERARKFAADMSSLTKKMLDITYPVISMFTGANFNSLLEEVFGNTQIEDLWIPFFCVTTDISVSKMRIHTTGAVTSYTRASMSLAGYLPPLCDPQDGHLLVDGGHVNNVPADVMKEMGAYEVIAADVGSKDETEFTNYGDSVSGWWLLWKRINPWAAEIKVPDMAEVQSRLAYVSCQRQLEVVKNMTRCEYIRPPIDAYGTLQFNAFDEIKDVGYNHVKAILKNWSPQCDDLVEKSRTSQQSKWKQSNIGEEHFMDLAQAVMKNVYQSPHSDIELDGQRPPHRSSSYDELNSHDMLTFDDMFTMSDEGMTTADDDDDYADDFLDFDTDHSEPITSAIEGLQQTNDPSQGTESSIEKKQL